MEYNFGTLDLGTYFFRPARVKHGHFTTREGGATWLLRSDGELVNWYTQNEWVRWGGEAVNYGPDDGRMRWSMASHDLGRGSRGRSEQDLEELRAAVQYQRGLGEIDDDYVQHGHGPDRSVLAIAKALDAARLQGGHALAHDHDHDHDHDEAEPDWGAPVEAPERPDERIGALRHVWGAGRAWRKGEPVPAPILSSRPVRSRTTGRWDGDGM
jgi:hypothetical protein